MMLKKWKTTTISKIHLHNYGPCSTFVMNLMEMCQSMSQVDRFAWYLTTPLVVFEIILNKNKDWCSNVWMFEKGAHNLPETLKGCYYVEGNIKTYQMTTTLVWMWWGGCLIKHNKTQKETLSIYILQSVQPNMRRWDTLNPKETQSSNNPQIVIEDQNTHQRNT
jgi:hypothetical protein